MTMVSAQPYGLIFTFKSSNQKYRRKAGTQIFILEVWRMEYKQSELTVITKAKNCALMYGYI